MKANKHLMDGLEQTSFKAQNKTWFPYIYAPWESSMHWEPG